MTINKGILLGFVPSGDTQVQLRSAQFEGEVCFRVDEIQHPIGLAIKNGASTLSPSKEKSIWGTYKARGAVYALQTSKKNLKQGIVGYLSGSNGLDSSGLSSSAAVSNRYRHTALQSSFSCNMVGICDGEPKLMGLKELLQAFIEFRCSVVERRARFKLSHAQQRKHIIEGIVVGLNNVDAVIELIKKASSHSAASAALQSDYGLSEKQAEAILEITLRRLTTLERKKFTDESSSLTEQITKLEQLLSTRANILKLIEQEAIELKDRFSSPRRSMLEDSDCGDLEDIDVIPNEEMLMAISEKGYVKRMKADTFNLQHRGTIGKSVGKLRVDDAMSDFLVMHMTMSSSLCV